MHLKHKNLARNQKEIQARGKAVLYLETESKDQVPQLRHTYTKGKATIEVKRPAKF